MHLYFLRHGPAGSKAHWSGHDEERPLTEDGRAVVLAVAPDVEFDLVVLAAQRIAFDEPSDLSMVPGVLSLQRLFMASQLRGKVLKRAFSLVENEYVIREPHLPAGLACT